MTLDHCQESRVDPRFSPLLLEIPGSLAIAHGVAVAGNTAGYGIVPITGGSAVGTLFEQSAGANSSPAPNGGSTSYLHGGPEHDAAIDEYIKNRIPKGAQDIRKNQAQVDVNGNVVGENRPDIQYNLNGQHYVVEIDTNPTASSAHAVRIQQNDPNAHVTQISLGKKP